MLVREFVDIKVRRVSADALDAIRPLARRYGYRHTNSDAVRFAVEMVALALRHATRPLALEQVLAERMGMPDLTDRGSAASAGGHGEGNRQQRERGISGWQ